jgi:hypothetical protein
MDEIEVGQVLNMRIRFNNHGVIAKTKHPYLVVGIDKELNTIEIAQLDSLANKEWKAAKRSNKTIFCDDPIETVIDKDSYVQLDNTIKAENFVGISKFRRQKDKLSPDKLSGVLDAYYKYHRTYEIDEDKQVYMDKEEIEKLN